MADSQGRVWSEMLALLFTHSISRANPEASWPRVLKSMLQGELDIVARASAAGVLGVGAGSSQGLVERLYDRYVQIFKAVQANRIAEVSTSLKVRSAAGYGSHILYGTAIGFDASFAFARSVLPRGWTLVHFAAQVRRVLMRLCLLTEHV